MNFKQLIEELKIVLNEFAIDLYSGQIVPFKTYNYDINNLIIDYFDRIKNNNTRKIRTPGICNFSYINPFNNQLIKTNFETILGNKNTGMYHIYIRHLNEGVDKAIAKLPDILNNVKPNEFLIEEQQGKVLTDRVLLYKQNYLYIFGIPDIDNPPTVGNELCYLHDVYSYTNSQYQKLKNAQKELKVMYLLQKGIK